MGQRIAGPGKGLPTAQNYYPTELQNAAQDFSSNALTLVPGQAVAVPAGEYMVHEGQVSHLQWMDPIMGIWRCYEGFRGQYHTIYSDGYNFRLANLTACPVSATVSGGGSSYTQATCTITANVGGSLWKPIVGGSLSVISVANAGANYTMPPIVAIPDGPMGLNVPASGYAVIASGTVSGVTLVNVGAGYTTAPTPLVLLPNPADPNAGTITNATIAIGLTNAGKITAALCTNNGASLATISALTLTAAGGAGTGATITPNVLQVVTSVSIAGAGAGLSASNEVTSTGGLPVSVSVIGNPIVELGPFPLSGAGAYPTWRPRKASLTMAVAGTSATSVSAIYDTGMFLSTPTAVFVNNGITSTAPTLTALMGGIEDTVSIQPAA